MANYKVLSPLIHDGKEYQPGDEIELKDTAIITSLLQGDVIIESKKTTSAKPPAKDEK